MDQHCQYLLYTLSHNFSRKQSTGILTHCLTNGSFGESTFIFRGIRSNFNFLSQFFDKISLCKQNSPRWDAAFCIVSHIWDYIVCLCLTNRTPGLNELSWFSSYPVFFFFFFFFNLHVYYCPNATLFLSMSPVLLSFVFAFIMFLTFACCLPRCFPL